MSENYAYPLADDWSTDEIITVTHFYQLVENAYELSQGVLISELTAAYRAFKTIVTSKSQEKQLDKAFGKVTGYSIYLTMKQSRETTKKSVKMSTGRDAR
ncbi:hypothetical protein AYR62_04640 [Secundilactobacillus paracollinoides]|uniref:Uncharacterized protein n=1 Tax=Secundilactobacillus paracollinoides TaxID=240427 RepID=A0A1B2J095_9LACO|nr:UPF0223 family protein [Secundilactobacillus paracollinoides]ANZ61803.1 hypothetical protein AYR61_10920 [Secundilactobacillus paracollinoides]ANZ63440.1 hypothetical protein AYR62_04640 [Secundilactobacillus paracollinoides]ANZ67722.1 hypothetical protein AYR63_11675 [Secundilactobacillus paracollinoides]KRL75798.1 hypothetical protein FC17_GL002531 [Secundilactobacillus paracollinoides DSM 15502 = JCM 11969]